ncbi:MAG: hypothetical protein CMO20_01165 [Thermoplasmata archaeon]|nr:hypothetical protein [Thermoplasmata archaeon]
MLHETPVIHSTPVFIKGGRLSYTMRNRRFGSRATTYFLISVLFISLIPTVQASIGISLSSSPTTQVINPGENGTYDITVTNTGDEDMTVQLSSAQGQDCTGWTSTIEQVTGQISGGGSETVTLTVTVPQNAESGADCETTVTGTGTAPLNAPETGDVVVTTTVGEGSGGTITGVDLTSANPDRTYNGNNPITWTVNVENTGQAQNETIQLSFESNSTCDSDLSATVDPDTVMVESGESEVVTVEVTVPEGTQSGNHCFYLKGVVTTPQTPEQASDFINLNLEVPEMKECSALLSDDYVNVDPDETKSYSITFANEGNTDWTIGFSVNSQKNWISVSGGSTALLPYDNGMGQTTFSFDVTPDDSLPAGSVIDFSISGLDGSQSKCSDLLQVELGQTKGGDVQLSSSRIDNIDPGETRSVLVTSINVGNGQETYSLGVTTHNGWNAVLASSSISLEGRHSSSGSTGDILLEITAPEDALATEELTFDVSLFSAEGVTYTSTPLTVSVAAKRSMTASMMATEQFGKTNEIARFPVTFTNTGNIQDSYTLTVCDEPPSSNPNECDSPKWPARFSDDSGSEITSVTLSAGSSTTIYADVTVQGDAEFIVENFQIRIRNVNDVNIQERFDIKVIVSNHIYRMGMALQTPGEIPDLQEVELPPEGQVEVWVIVTNIGSSAYLEEAIISVQGMDSETSVAIYYQNGTELTGTIQLENNQSELLRVVITVLEGVENGASGMVKVSASSGRNAGELSTVRISLSVRTNHEILFDVDGDVSRSIEYGEISIITVNVTNNGNVEETVRMLNSEPMRGWAIEITEEEVILEPGEMKSIDVIIKPPTNLEQSDEFEFTITAEPVSSPVSAQPIDLSVTANPPTGFFSGGSNFQAIGLSLLGFLILGAIISAFRGRRN